VNHDLIKVSWVPRDSEHKLMNVKFWNLTMSWSNCVSGIITWGKIRPDFFSKILELSTINLGSYRTLGDLIK